MADRTYSYTLVLEPDPESGTHTVTVPALPGIVTQGNSVEDAVAMGRDAIQCHIEGLLANGEPVPEEQERPQTVTIRAAA